MIFLFSSLRYLLNLFDNSFLIFKLQRFFLILLNSILGKLCFNSLGFFLISSILLDEGCCDFIGFISSFDFINFCCDFIRFFCYTICFFCGNPCNSIIFCRDFCNFIIFCCFSVSLWYFSVSLWYFFGVTFFSFCCVSIIFCCVSISFCCVSVSFCCFSVSFLFILRF